MTLSITGSSPYPTSYSFPSFRDCSLNCVTQKTEETESHVSVCVDTASQHPLADSRTPHATITACDFAQQPVAREGARSGQTQSFEGSCPALGPLQHSPGSPVTVELWSGYSGAGRPSLFFWTSSSFDSPWSGNKRALQLTGCAHMPSKNLTFGSVLKNNACLFLFVFWETTSHS